MATAEQIKSLIRSYIIDDSEHFVTIALQVAAHEARLGHGALAHDIRKLVDKAKQERGSFRTIKFPQDLSGLVISEKPSVSLSSLVLLESLRKRIDRIIFEYRQQNKLKTHGLSNRRKILLIGPPGTGKTMSAQVLAHELGLILHTVQVDKLVTKFMGETSAKLRQIFEFIEKEKGVFLFDEFDAIGGERSLENDVGEMRRVLNAFLQFIENDSSDSLIIAATNSPRNLDRALFRRFDDVLYYDNPSDDARKRLIRNVLGSFLPTRLPWTQIVKESAGLSHAEIDYSCRDAIKFAILSDKKRVNEPLLIQMLAERKATHWRE